MCKTYGALRVAGGRWIELVVEGIQHAKDLQDGLLSRWVFQNIRSRKFDAYL